MVIYDPQLLWAVIAFLLYHILASTGNMMAVPLRPMPECSHKVLFCVPTELHYFIVQLFLDKEEEEEEGEKRCKVGSPPPPLPEVRMRWRGEEV